MSIEPDLTRCFALRTQDAERLLFRFCNIDRPILGRQVLLDENMGLES